MANNIMSLMIATAASTAAMCLYIPAARASFGDAPWCVAVMTYIGTANTVHLKSAWRA